MWDDHQFSVCYRCEEEREYLKRQQAEVEHKLEVVCKTEADAKAEAKHAQLRYEDRDSELNERAALLRRQETELVGKQTPFAHVFPEGHDFRFQEQTTTVGLCAALRKCCQACYSTQETLHTAALRSTTASQLDSCHLVHYLMSY